MRRKRAIRHARGDAVGQHGMEIYMWDLRQRGFINNRESTSGADLRCSPCSLQPIVFGSPAIQGWGREEEEEEEVRGVDGPSIEPAASPLSHGRIRKFSGPARRLVPRTATTESTTRAYGQIAGSQIQISSEAGHPTPVRDYEHSRN